MSSNLLFLPDFEYADVALPDTLQRIELKHEPLSPKNETNNWGFIIFLICFFILVYIISHRTKLLLSMASGVFRNTDRHSIFFEPLNNDLFNKILLCFQTILLISVITYCVVVHEQIFPVSPPSGMFIILGITAVVWIVFFLYKFLSYSLIGTIFFKKEVVRQWNDNLVSLICLSGSILFFPALILFYVEEAYIFCLYFIFIYLFFVSIVLFYKIFTLFFQRKRLLHYFILYLCTQEIIPLFLMYRGLVYLFLSVQKDTLWI
jgi:hypothetical protein